MMTLTERDRRALMALGVAVILSLALYFWPAPTIETVGPTVNDAQSAAVRLDKVRQEAAMAPVRQQQLQETKAALARLEKGLIAGDSLPQAQAQMVQIVRRIARAQVPPLALGSTDFGPTRPFNGPYGQVLLTVTAECQVDQLVNFLSDVAAQPELVAVEEIHVATANAKQKLIPVRLVLAGLIPGTLLKTTPAGGAR
ncbi:MAG: GspMb/PilO family protein [Acidobacteria bacterium]|nr:GspMb/PilO family protein [Acidobacteriota bacterium]